MNLDAVHVTTHEEGGVTLTFLPTNDNAPIKIVTLSSRYDLEEVRDAIEDVIP